MFFIFILGSIVIVYHTYLFIYQQITDRMNKRQGHVPVNLPENIGHWQANFTEMKHKVIDYLRKHTPDESHPIVDAKHYLILNSSNKNIVENPSLNCVKYKKDHILPSQPEYHHHTNRKQLIIEDQTQQKMDRDNIFRHKGKASSPNYAPHMFDQDFRHIFPAVCSLRPDEARQSEDGHRLATLKKKLQTYKGTNKEEKEVDNTSSLQKQRYHSIEIHRKKEEKEVKPRAHSTLKRVIGDKDRIKTHNDHQRKNIFFIPVAQYIKEHQQAQENKNHQAKPKQEGTTQSQKDIAKEVPEQLLMKSEASAPSTTQLDKPQESELFPKVSIYGIEPIKEVCNTTHKRFYGHAKEHKAEVKLLEKEKFQKFDCSPWQQLKQQATITNLDAIDP